jgi:hypothetical protein
MAEIHTDLRASTSSTSRKGTPFAAELDRKLAGDEPLIKVVNWWSTAYREWREPLLSAGNAPPLSFTENESTVNHLGVVWMIEEIPGELTEDIKDPIVQEAWGPVRQARAALHANVDAQASRGMWCAVLPPDFH